MPEANKQGGETNLRRIIKQGGTPDKLVRAAGLEPAVRLATTGLKVPDLQPFDNTRIKRWLGLRVCA